MADYNVAGNSFEYSDLIPMPQISLPTFMIKNDYVVSQDLLVIDYYIGATLAKSLDNFRCLRACSTSRMGCECTIGTSGGPFYLP